MLHQHANSAEGKPDSRIDLQRRRAMEAFAAGNAETIKRAVEKLGLDTGVQTLRGPETGLIMLRGRIAGGGNPFNFGEASVSRATIRLSTGEIGHAMVLGRNTDHARCAAILDAAWQRESVRDQIEAEIITPILHSQAERDRKLTEETEATRVDFFTMVRGDD